MRHAIAIALSAALLAPAAAELSAQAERVELRGDPVAIHNLAGEVRLRPGSGPAVVVTVTRGGPDAARLRVESGVRDGVETLRVVYPDDRVVYAALGRGHRSQLRVREDGTLGEGGRRVTVAGRGDGLEAHADLTVEVPRGRALAVHHGAGEISITDVEGEVVVDAASGRVTASGVGGFLGIDTGSGSVDVSRTTGDVRVDTGSGGVSLTDLDSPRLYVDTGSGRVTGSGIRGEEVRIDTGSGGIRLSDVGATDIRLDTGSGGVELDLASDVRLLEIDTGSGGVTLGIPEGLGAEIEVETGSGGIDFDFPVRVSRAGRDRLVATLGDGAGRIRIDTGSGGVRLRRR